MSTAETSSSKDVPASRDGQPSEAAAKGRSVSDIVTYPDNRATLTAFVSFAVALAVAPLFVFFITRYAATMIWDEPGQLETIIPVVSACLTVNGIIGLYAVLAYREEQRDWQASALKSKGE
eukprot:GHVU01079358.1.p2 GENE.GHVU01079358.1~~GHVU01079358.1.p2  ORF type:complete len:121 (+),score=15.52 GHVU01079358.1:76-438(+)